MNSHHFPPAFEKRMKESMHDEWSVFEESHQHPSPISVRVNPRKKIVPPSTSHVPWCDNGYYLTERPSFTLDPTFHAGAYYVQEASSMFLEHVFKSLINQDQALNILDLCAAPGGKSTHLLSLMNAKSLLVSNEVIRARANVLAQNIQKWGYCNAVVTNNDPEDFKRLKGFFDVMVVDAPCSGEGLFRKDPSAKKEWSEENVTLCSKRQRRILSDVWPALKENGILIYATCTYNQAENEENLQWLSENHSVEFLSLNLDPTWGIEEVEAEKVKGYRFYPHRVKGEGFFITAIRKLDHEQEPHLKNSKNSFTSPSKKTLEKLDSWVLLPQNKTFIQRDDLLQFFLIEHLQIIEYLSKNLRLITAGTFMATLKHDKLVPEHAMALSTEINHETFFKLELNREEALQFLRKETLNLSPAHHGFALATFQNLSLGWANVLPNRINNLYPSEWRIRLT